MRRAAITGSPISHDGACQRSLKWHRRGLMQQHEPHVFRIFVNGRRPERSVRAMEVLMRLCRQYLPERHRIIPVDITVNPEQLRTFDVATVPTVIREYPTP